MQIILIFGLHPPSRTPTIKTFVANAAFKLSLSVQNSQFLLACVPRYNLAVAFQLRFYF
jgi:hypothetical protein